MGGNIWESSATGAKTTLNLVAINGVNTAMGRYPNAGTTNGGYLSYESHSDPESTWITDNQLTGIPDWTGAEVVVKKAAWIINRGIITNHTTNTLTFTDPSKYSGYNGWGYFIQNDLRTLDTLGEWFLNKSTLKLSVYSNANPGTTVKLPVYDTLVYALNKSYITFTNLKFEGYNVYGFYINGGSSFRILDCDINMIGKDAINNPNHSYLYVRGCFISNINDNVVNTNSGSTNAYFGYNNVTKCSLIPGNAGVGDGHNFGVSLQADNSITEFNKVTNMGYIGLLMAGNNTIIRNNYIDSVCTMKDDGGGIYVSGALTNIMTGRIIRKNIVKNAFGNSDGKQDAISAKANGIYVDGTGNYVTIDSNVVHKATNGGIYLGFYVHHITVTNNILFDWKYDFLKVHNTTTPGNNVFNSNQMVSLTENNILAYYLVGTENPKPLPIEEVVTFSGNYYCPNLYTQSAILEQNYKKGYFGVYDRTIQGVTTIDATAKYAPSPLTPKYIINFLIGSNKITNGTFDANTNGWGAHHGSGTSTLSWDNTSKITGIGSLKYVVVTPSSAQNQTSVRFLVGNMDSGKKYVLRFKILGTGANKYVNPIFSANGSVWITSRKAFNYTTSITSHEIIILPTATASGVYLWMRFCDTDMGTVYLDDVQLYEADITLQDPTLATQLIYNETNKDRVISLPYAMVDITNTKKSGSITLKPYTGKVLFLDPSPATTQMGIVTLHSVAEITSRKIIIGGNVVYDGGGTISAKGVCWSTSANPTISNSKTIDGTGTAEYISTMTNLSPNTMYHVRAYATNEAGTSYSSDYTFTTKN